MFNWFNMNKKSLPQKVLENSEKIIEILERGLFDYQGEYNTNTIYKKNDCVKYNNTLYIYKNTISSKGILPTDTDYWDIFQQDTGTLVKDINGNNLSTCTFSGHNGINVDMDENDPNDFNIRLDQEVANRIAKSLVTPIAKPSERSFVMLGINNAQDNVSQSDIFKTIYPIGSVYISTNETSPASFIGGTWEKIQDRFLLSSGSRALGEIGGSTSHNHSLNNGFAKIGYGWSPSAENTLYGTVKGGVSYVTNFQTSNDTPYGQGGSEAGSGVELGGTTDNTETLPPNLVVNIWKRIA